jgi:hypothetical protein
MRRACSGGTCEYASGCPFGSTAPSRRITWVGSIGGGAPGPGGGTRRRMGGSPGLPGGGIRRVCALRWGSSPFITETLLIGRL